jgi:hypothetical protein
MIDAQKIRREASRWHIMQTLDNSRPYACHENTVLAVVQSVYPDATALEVRRNLDYLADRQLVTIEKKPEGVWWAELSRYGVDIVEYTVDCEPGIARPQRG